MIKKILISLLMILVVAVGGYLAYSFGKKSAEKALTQSAGQEAPVSTQSQTTDVEKPATDQGIPVKVAQLEQRNITIAQTFYGTVVPYAEANVQGEQAGKITFLKGKEGDSVKKGELIVQFDDSDIQLEIQRAIANKNTTVQMVNQARSNFETVQANVQRYEELFKEGFVPRQQVDEINNQSQVAQASLNTALEGVKQADTQISLFQNALADFKLSAPINGIIDEKYYNLSEVYRAGDILYHLIDIDRIYVEVEVPESYISQIQENMQVQVFFDSLQDQEFAGEIERIIPKGDPQSRNFLAKTVVKNPGHKIKPGMFSRVSVEIQSIPEALVLDKKALVKEGEKSYVFKVVDNQVKKIPVNVEYEEGTTIAVASDGLQAGDQIVIEGTHLLKPDVRVKIL